MNLSDWCGIIILILMCIFLYIKVAKWGGHKMKKYLGQLSMNQLVYHLRRLKNKQEREDIWIMIESLREGRTKEQIRHAFYQVIK